MEGDIIRTICDNHAWIGHYHTAGVPGRHELDQTQELNYAVVKERTREITHDMALARFASRVVPIRDGEVVDDQPAAA